jgi:L-gulonolactone oxidase
MWWSEPRLVPVPGAGASAVALPLPAGVGTPVRRPARVADLPEHAMRYVAVRTEGDIRQAILSARQAGLTVRALGAQGSKNTCYRTSGVALRLDRYDRVLAVDGHRVVAEAGATVAGLNAHLARHGLTLPTQGEWLGARVAGAVATGVHGGALTHGILATSVAALRLILADGSALEIDRGSDLFPHAAVSLGTLGVTSSVTFECVPVFHLELVSRVVSFADYVRDHEAAARDHEFLSAIWIPTARRVVTFAANRVAPPVRVVRRRQRYSFTSLVLSAASRRLDLHDISDRWFAHRAVDRADRILTPIAGGTRQVRLLRALTRAWREAEFAVPVTRAAEVLTALEEVLARYPLALRIPVGLRATAADPFALSPCSERASFWIALFYRDGGGLSEELRRLFERFDGRPHWGKHVDLSPAHLRRQYRHWDAFRAARRRLDPEGVFANAYTRRVGL